ncbi:MAG: hypothetical protein JW800_08000 [Candidatus Omnitrophica bacterium]|nr:hypothetical protein [Candidatus Omnitrophota bacterium]
MSQFSVFSFQSSVFSYQSSDIGRLTDKRGMVLIYVFIAVILLAAITSSFLFMTVVKMRGSGYDSADAKALWIAEGGLERYIYLLSTDSDYRDDYPDLEDDLGDGSYLVEATYDEPTSTYILTSTGTAGYLSRRITRSVVVTEGSLEAFNYAQHSGGNIDFKDSEGTVDGDISAAGNVNNEDDMAITGTITESSSVTMPTVNYDSYEAIADPGQIVTGNKTFAAGVTESGIWYITGKATINDNVTINGTVVAEGNIVLDNSENVTITPTSNYPALIAGGKISGKKLEDSTINGLIFAENSIELNENKNVVLNGSMIAGGKIEMKDGDADCEVNYDTDILIDPPPYFSGGGTITAAPEDDWDEVAAD